MFLATFRPTFQEQTPPSYSAFAVRLGSKSENRANLNTDSGFSSMPASTSTSSSTSPPESSSNTGDSDSDQDKMAERRSKVAVRPKTKKLVATSGGGAPTTTPGWISAVSPLSSSICEKCEAGEVTRQQLETEVERLSREVTSTRQTILRLHEREEKMKER